MELLIASGIISLAFGLILLFQPKFLTSMSSTCNKVVIDLDTKIKPYRLILGLILIVVAFWKFYTVVSYELGVLLHVSWMLALALGILLLFLPWLLDKLNKILDKVILSTDDMVIRSRKIVGIVLIVAGLYMLYGAYDTYVLTKKWFPN